MKNILLSGRLPACFAPHHVEKRSWLATPTESKHFLWRVIHPRSCSPIKVVHVSAVSGCESHSQVFEAAAEGGVHFSQQPQFVTGLCDGGGRTPRLPHNIFIASEKEKSFLHERKKKRNSEYSRRSERTDRRIVPVRLECSQEGCYFSIKRCTEEQKQAAVTFRSHLKLLLVCLVSPFIWLIFITLKEFQVSSCSKISHFGFDGKATLSVLC